MKTFYIIRNSVPVHIELILIH